MLKKLASTVLMLGIGATLVGTSGCYVRSTTRGGYHRHHGHVHHNPPPPRRTTTIVVRP